MKNFWHIMATIGIAALGAAVPTVRNLIVANPVASTVLGVAWTVLGNLLQSPLTPAAGK